MVNLVRKFFSEFDMFSSPATFRTRGEPEIKNPWAGAFSFVVLLLFTFLFIWQFTEVANLQRIEAKETQITILDSEREVKNFMIGFGVEGLRIEGITEFLRLEVKQITNNGSKVIGERILLT
jgi:type VI protein secretion system component VasK